MEINILKYFTVKRFVNSLQVLASFQLSKILRKPVVWGMPLTYSVEPTNHCNLQCPECPSGLGELTRPLGLLSAETFRQIVDQISDRGFYIQLFFQGEPYINKNLPEMTRYAQSKNIYISISTNGLLLSEKRINEILENPPDKLIFSIDGLDQQTYENYRVGGKFSDAAEALKLLITKKRANNLKKPYIELQFIVMKQNEHQIDDVIRFGKEAGVDKVALKTMQISSYENAVHFLPENKKYSRYKLENGEVKMKNKLKNHCFALWRTSVITWDGKVVPCCFDKDAKYEIDNLKDNSFKQIWRGSKYQKFRQAVLNNRQGIDICTNCTEGLKINIGEI